MNRDEHVTLADILDALTRDAGLPRSLSGHVDACPSCARILIEAREVLDLMRSDDLGDAPESWITRAVAAPDNRRAVERVLASISFDSATSPAPESVRRAGDGSRQLVLTADPFEIELRIASAGSRERWSVSGQIFRLDDAPIDVSQVTVIIRSNRALTPADRVTGEGEFLVSRRPDGPFRVIIAAGNARIESPMIDPADG